jgi:hypothetical protein
MEGVLAKATTATPTQRQERAQIRDDGARALRAVFSTRDNWSDLSEVERDEWRGYFEGMLERLGHLGYTVERSSSSVLLKAQSTRESTLRAAGG